MLRCEKVEWDGQPVKSENCLSLTNGTPSTSDFHHADEARTQRANDTVAKHFGNLSIVDPDKQNKEVPPKAVGSDEGLLAKTTSSGEVHPSDVQERQHEVEVTRRMADQLGLGPGSDWNQVMAALALRDAQKDREHDHEHSNNR